jgi:hypothetical protein
MKPKRIYLYTESHLPENGWFQGCLRCASITARLQLHKTIIMADLTKEVYVYICIPCQKSLTISIEEQAFQHICAQVLDEYQTPVEPKPPSPRSVSSNESTN